MNKKIHKYNKNFKWNRSTDSDTGKLYQGF